MNELVVYDTIVIGGGPAGLMCALVLAKNGAHVALLEKNSSVGRKLLLAGGGRCNISHEGSPKELTDHYFEAAHFVKHSLFAFPPEALKSFCKELNLPLVCDAEGKLFPHTMKSVDVVKTFSSACENAGVELFVNTTVLSFVKHAKWFTVRSADHEFKAKNVVVATGGITYPQTGSSGDGHALLALMGHTIAKCQAALTPVFSSSPLCAKLSGISLPEAHVAIARNGKRICTGRGSLLFTHKGLSGPAILNLSRYVEMGDAITVRAHRFVSAEELDAELLKLCSQKPNISIKNMMVFLKFPERLLNELLLSLGISSSAVPCSSLDKVRRKAIAKACFELHFVVSSCGGNDAAMVTRGGVARSELHAATLESRLVDGVYVLGELVDVDGDTGGYNIHFALASGYSAAQAILKSQATVLANNQVFS